VPSERTPPAGISCSAVRDYLDGLSAGVHYHLPPATRAHIDECPSCSNFYNQVKWKLSDGSSDLAELKEFLGNEFKSGVDASAELANEWKIKSPQTPDQVLAFYRETSWYAYNLVLWQASGRRPNYVERAQPILRRYRCESIVDFGAGVGNDALKLAALGYHVIAVDFDNMSSRFLRYRADVRKLANFEFIDIDSADLSTIKPDALWAMDVIEHLINPVQMLAPVLQTARLLIYDSEHTGTSCGKQNFHFQHPEPQLTHAWKSMGYTSVSGHGDLHIYAKPRHPSAAGQTAVHHRAPWPSRPPLSGVVFDLDGVVWRDHRAIPGIDSAIRQAREMRLKVSYLTNNSSQSRGYLADRMRQLNLEVEPEDIFTAAHIAALHLSQGELMSRHYVTIGGGDALLDELSVVGLDVETLASFVDSGTERADTCSIVVGHSPKFGYDEVTELLRMSRQVQDIFASERDRWYASSTGPLPSSAWIIAAIEEVVNRKALTLGKPNSIALGTVATAMGIDVRSMLMVGDSLEIDIPAAHNAGALCCYFDDPRIHGADFAIPSTTDPDFIIRDLSCLQYIIRGLL
jgi:HAD superfamily hydrolase (TIGR01450 family)